MLGVATGPSEAETFWTEFLRSLADRALRGVKLVIADDHKGLPELLRAGSSTRPTQRCRVHWMRNALAHAPGQAAHGGRRDAEDDLRPGNQGRRPRLSGRLSPMRCAKSSQKLSELNGRFPR